MQVHGGLNGTSMCGMHATAKLVAFIPLGEQGDADRRESIVSSSGVDPGQHTWFRFRRATFYSQLKSKDFTHVTLLVENVHTPFGLLSNQTSLFRCDPLDIVWEMSHPRMEKDSREFHHNWTNSVLQLQNFYFGKFQMYCSEFLQ